MTMGTSSRIVSGSKRFVGAPALVCAQRPLDRLHVFLVYGDLHPPLDELRWIAQQIVKLGPQLYLPVRHAAEIWIAPVADLAAVPARRLPPDNALLQNDDIDTRAGQPPCRAEAGYTAAHDHYIRTVYLHPSSPFIQLKIFIGSIYIKILEISVVISTCILL